MIKQRDKDNFIKQTFIQLTSRTYPYGYENDVIEDMRKYGIFPEGLTEDESGNWFIKIGESKTMFSCHLDTACRDQVQVNHVFEGNMIKTDGRSVLGADDKAGMTILLYMIKNKVPGLYYFFFGEECGCVGSGIAAKDPLFKNYNKCVAFDRRDTDSIITYQSSKRCCSDDFARSLKEEFKIQGMHFKLDEGGIYTDSAEFVDVIPECTNISVGYYSEHTHSERQNIEHLEKLSQAVIVIRWENLVIKRDPSISENRYSRYSNMNDDIYNRNERTLKTWDDYDDRYGTRVNRDAELDERSTSWNGFQDGDYSGRRKKTRRGNGNRNRQFFAGPNGNIVPMIGNKVDIKNLSLYTSFHVNEGNRYEFLKEKLLDSKLTPEEIASVKEQYIDMNNKDDRRAFENLMNYMCV